MAPAVEARGFGFSYPEPAVNVRPSTSAAVGMSAPPALRDVSFTLEEGAFCTVTGGTGSGKTTLLRCLHPDLAPAGRRVGVLRVAAQRIGFVFQNPADQIVCDSVWHELALGLENAGMECGRMRRRVAEVAHYRKTASLSGGQMQLVNLAAVVALRPELLLLDEPTAQLDPHARGQFVALLGAMNQDSGCTVLVATHAPEIYEPYANAQVELAALPPLACWEGDGRDSGAEPAAPEPAALAPAPSASPGRGMAGQAAIELRDAYVRYGREDDWVLRGADLSVHAGSVMAVVGGNGCGKSTLLATLAGVLPLARGKIRNALAACQALMPQDPRALFMCDSVSEELHEWARRCGYSQEEELDAARRFGLEEALSQHPYDLSGGQQQNLAFAKLMLCRPRLLLLDEPAKGLDAHAAAEMARKLRGLAAEGVAVVFATHDVDFARVCADEVAMLFDGQVACAQPVEAFFHDNFIYRPHERCRLYGALALDSAASDLPKAEGFATRERRGDGSR